MLQVKSSVNRVGSAAPAGPVTLARPDGGPLFLRELQAGSTMSSLGPSTVFSFLWPPLGPWWGRGHRQWTQGLSWAWASCEKIPGS